MLTTNQQQTVLLRLTKEEAQFIQLHRSGELTNQPFTNTDESQALGFFVFSSPSFHRKQLQYISAAIIGYLGQEDIYQRVDYEEINDSLKTFVDRLGELRFAGEHF